MKENKPLLLCEVLNMCHRISVDSKADIFFEYSPHCDAYSVNYYRDGWTMQSTADDFVYLNCVTKITRRNLKVTLAKLNDIASELGVI